MASPWYSIVDAGTTGIPNILFTLNDEARSWPGTGLGAKTKKRAAEDQQLFEIDWRPQGDSNPRYRRERAVSWAGLDDGDVM